ncbi:unnamed protein product [Ilex paraguariensis]|uniref:Uncharacterized protein n=1 Tax=Ilex paraguariensis TaxID=185542 RepID=A0ABC8SZA1_9AQUA
MGIWDFINSTTDILKRNAPDLSVNGRQRVNQYMPNDEARAKIALFVTKLAKNAADYAVKEGVNSIPAAGTKPMALQNSAMLQSSMRLVKGPLSSLNRQESLTLS